MTHTNAGPDAEKASGSLYPFHACPFSVTGRGQV